LTLTFDLEDWRPIGLPMSQKQISLLLPKCWPIFKILTSSDSSVNM